MMTAMMEFVSMVIVLQSPSLQGHPVVRGWYVKMALVFKKLILMEMDFEIMKTTVLQHQMAQMEALAYVAMRENLV
jgi:hypothetical protein